MRKRRKNDRQKLNEMERTSGRICSAALALLILCSWIIGSIIVYGLDMSGMDGFDTGGFDMNVGEGTGQLPEDWEGSYGGTESNDSNDKDENPVENTTAGTVIENRWMENEQGDSSQWNSDFQAEDVYSPEENSMENGNTASENSGGNGERNEFQEPDIQENKDPVISVQGETNTVNTPAEESAETSEQSVPTKTLKLTKSPVPTQTSPAGPSATSVPKSVQKSTGKPTARESKKEKDQNPALSYYQTEPAETPDKKEEKEQTPTIHAEIDGNRVQIEISPDIPFQILSFRINGKECDFYWHGKKLLAELPEKIRKPWKAELIGFVKSEKLYYESMDLTEKQ